MSRYLWNYPARKVHGFSLVEIVIALGVISFALVAIIGLLPIGLASGRATIQETRANNLAEEIFATLRSQPFTAASLNSLNGPATPIDLSIENTSTGTPGPILRATYDGQFVATSDYFTIELRFRNAAEGIISGTASEVRVQISLRESGAPRMDYVSIIAAH
jgi:type II secretory pathway pseudopilin PulG